VNGARLVPFSWHAPGARSFGVYLQLALTIVTVLTCIG
jgi:hypothetical protein